MPTGRSRALPVWRTAEAKDAMSFCEHCEGQRFDRAQVLRVLRATRKTLRKNRQADEALVMATQAVRRPGDSSPRTLRRHLRRANHSLRGRSSASNRQQLRWCGAASQRLSINCPAPRGAAAVRDHDACSRGHSNNAYRPMARVGGSAILRHGFRGACGARPRLPWSPC